MKFKRKIYPNTKPLSNFITKKRLKEDEINFTKLRAYRLDRVKKELEKITLRHVYYLIPSMLDMH